VSRAIFALLLAGCTGLDNFAFKFAAPVDAAVDAAVDAEASLDLCACPPCRVCAGGACVAAPNNTVCAVECVTVSGAPAVRTAYCWQGACATAAGAIHYCVGAACCAGPPAFCAASCQ
jgi:hypothetical protein